MVTWTTLERFPLLWAAAERPQTLLEKLTPLNQIRVIVGLAAVLVLGLVIFLVIKAGSHMVKGLSAAANRLPSSSLPEEDDWASKPLNKQPEDES